MLTEVDSGKFWSHLHIKPSMTKQGDAQIYKDQHGAALGYINTFVRRYFLVSQDEGEKDLAFVLSVKLTQEAATQQAKQEKKAKKGKVDIFTKYPHAIPGTRYHDDKTGHDRVRIKCICCGDESREVNTTDLFQSKKCVKCQEATTQQRKSEEKKAREMVASKKIIKIGDVIVTDEFRAEGMRAKIAGGHF